MADTIPSPILGLPVPNVDQAPGPQWATDINNCMAIIDSHGIINASSGFVTPAGINVNTEFAFNDFDATLLRSVRFQNQPFPLATPLDLSCAYAAGADGDLYFNDGNGNEVQITANGGVAGSPGSISGLSSPASASYVSANETFVWQSAVNTPANMDAASLLLRNLTANSKALTLQPPAAMGANYAITLPPLPLQTEFVNMDTSGNMGTWELDNSTIVVSSGTVQVPAGGITQTQMAANSVGTAQLIALNVTKPKLSAANYAVSSSSGGFSTTTGNTFIDVTNLNVTLTTSGRPVFLLLQPDTSASSSFGVNTSGNAIWVQFVRGTTALGAGIWDNFNGSTATNYGATMFKLDVPAAGTYTWKIQIKLTGSLGGADANMVNYQLMAMEM